MNKELKFITLNEISNDTNRLLYALTYLRDSVKFGLQKGKLGMIPEIIHLCEDLAGALETYNSDSFTLEDLQDYKG